MKKLKIDPGCISCGTCVFMAPDVFEITDKSQVKTNANLSLHKEEIDRAIASCPMNIIHYAEKSDEPR